ncbi:hypothetical protein L6164_003335 [Bauhinia variegata]|uniref:Uncharacterized protein n=1 Tax=Bauhinia variegata TaxID=167791 RepID=A0ACB9Q111_BAUVA|nr:hypothetical protein L6164_003335 [Bauhinia variegata]
MQKNNNLIKLKYDINESLKASTIIYILSVSCPLESKPPNQTPTSTQDKNQELACSPFVHGQVHLGHCSLCKRFDRLEVNADRFLL